MQTINCILCESNAGYPIISEDLYIGRKCTICDLIFVSPRPTLEAIISIYKNDKSAIYSNPYSSNTFYKLLHSKHTIQLLSNYSPTGSILDIGAGGGNFLKQAVSSGYDPFAIELNKNNADYISKQLNIPCEQRPFDLNSFQNISFDIVYHCNLLSHLYDPVKTFLSINSKLNDTGLLFFETGNLGGLPDNLLNKFDKFDLPDHLFFFGNKSIELLLNKTGFKLINIATYSLAPNIEYRYFKANIKSLVRHILHTTTISKYHSNNNSNQEQISDLNISKIRTRYIYQYIDFILTYKIGSYLFKKDRPQTMIVVAKKL